VELSRHRRWSTSSPNVGDRERSISGVTSAHGRRECVLVQRMACIGFKGRIVPDGTAASTLKTLIVLVRQKPIAVVLPAEFKISFKKVAEHLGDPSATVSLAPSELVKSLCGFPIGSVPPICHEPVLKILVDSGGLHGEVAGGCGDPQQELLTRWEDLLQARFCEAADIIKY